MKGNETAALVRAFDRAYINGHFVTPHGRRGFSGYRNTWNLKPSSANREMFLKGDVSFQAKSAVRER